MTEESAVKVCIRVRPFVPREDDPPSENGKPRQDFWKADAKSIHQVEDGTLTKSFSFDRVFTADESTNQLYQAIGKPLVVSTVEGYNGTIFAYGQTSSGKTFTMMGDGHSGSGGVPGVIPLAVEDVFQTIKNFPKKEFLLRVSYMEIYNETVVDLLVDNWKRKPLEVRETMNKNVFVAELTEELVTSLPQALAWIRKGEKNRHYGKTKMNQRSSRSHTIFRMILESRERSDPVTGENADGAIIVSHLNLVDLAGSERASQTGAEGVHFKEGCNINRSLFTLGQVIKKLTDESQKGFTNYRDSKLTRILQNSLGGNAKTVIICTITPDILEDTLSTLQFASTAKKMKNDPHVTEVSDDGALLKRYRNEIVELKRRLQEVSSVTQTTATEKEVLSQLLQEKESLQREQEDKIKSLTKLLVTSSNQIPVIRMPKRRATWGGKMLKLANPSMFNHPSFSRKRKADRSCLSVMCEDDDEFDTEWGIPDEPSDDTEAGQGGVTVRSFGDSPRDASTECMCDLSSKVWNLELQLDMESQQKEEAVKKAEALSDRVAELQLQIESRREEERPEGDGWSAGPQPEVAAEEGEESPRPAHPAAQRVTELELQLEAETREKRETLEKVAMLELRVADLEQQSHSHVDEQTRRDFAETIQLCEALASEKELVVTERDYLQQELGKFLEQTNLLEKERAALQQELRENREMEEFKSLEEQFRSDQEKEFREELGHLKSALESSEAQRRELQNKLESVSEQLKKKTEFAEELQNMSGKDLVQEVATLRRSLDDAEGLSRDTKKEWAHLRSENIALEETNMTLTANHDKMQAEVGGLRLHLEAEKARYKQMQSDLQKELNVAFEENTKLSSLLAGRVPKTLTDSLELERTVACLSKELTASQEAEKTLRAQLESFPAQMDALAKQAADAHALVQSLQLNLEEEQQKSSDLSKLCEQKDSEAEMHMLTLSQELQSERQEKETLLQAAGQNSAEALDELRAALAAVSAERDQLNLDLRENVDIMIEVQEELRTAMEKNRKQKELIKQLETAKASSPEEPPADVGGQLEELQAQITQLSESLQTVREEKQQLEEDLQCNQNTVSSTQELLKSIQEELQEEKNRKSDLENQTREKENFYTQQISELSEKLQTVEAERTALLCEREASSETSSLETETLQRRVTSLTEDRDQLQEMLEALRQEKQQFSDQLDDTTATPHAEVRILTEELQQMKAEKAALLCEKETSSQQAETLQRRVTSLSEDRDQLQEMLEVLRQEKQQLSAQLEDNREAMQCDFQHPLSSGGPSLKEEQDAQQIQQLQEQVERTTEEICQLRSEFEKRVETITQLRETLQTIREEKQQLEEDLQHNQNTVSSTQELLKSIQEELQEEKNRKSDLENQTQEKETFYTQQISELSEKLQTVEAEREALLCEREASSETSSLEAETLQRRVTSLTEDRDQLQEMLEALRREKQQLSDQLEDNKETITQLSETLQTVREEKQKLEEDLQSNENTVSSTQELLKSIQEELQEEKNRKSDLENQTREKENFYTQQISELSEKLQAVEAERAALLPEREASSETSSLETETLQRRVTSLTEDRDQLQEMLEALRREKQQLSDQLEDNKETITQLSESLQTVREEKQQLEEDLQCNQNTVSSTQELLKSIQEELQEEKNRKSDLESQTQEKENFYTQQISELSEKLQTVEAERTALLCEREASSETSSLETETLQRRVTSLTEDRDQLQEMLEALRQEKQQFSDQLDDTTATLQAEVRILTEELQQMKAEKAALLCENETSSQQAETLQRRVTSLSEDRDQLQEMLEALRREKQQLSAQLEDTTATLHAEVTRLTEELQQTKADGAVVLSEKASSETSTLETETLQRRVTSLSEARDELQEMLEALRQEKQQVSDQLEDNKDTVQQLRERHAIAEANAEISQQLLGEANATISALREQISSAERHPAKVGKRASVLLQDSTEQFQEVFLKLQQFIDSCRLVSNPDSMKEALGDLTSLTHSFKIPLPKATTDAYEAVRLAGQPVTQMFIAFIHRELSQFQSFRQTLEELVKKDVAVFEERRLQDVLLCRAQAPDYSVREEDFEELWERRLGSLLAKRQSYLQKVAGPMETLQSDLRSFMRKLKSELGRKISFMEELYPQLQKQPVNTVVVDSLLGHELARRTAAAAQIEELVQQSITDKHSGLFEELKRLEAQADSELGDERSKNVSLLKALEGAPLKTELSLLRDNQQLTQQLQQAVDKVKAVCVENEQLKGAQVKVSSWLSNQKQATQLLQTELQDSRALVEEKEDSIRSLRSKLRESETRVPPSAAELDKLKTKLLQMEATLSSAADEHQKELKRMNAVLNEKEESLRKLKETLRKSQQEGEDSFLQGKDLHAKLTKPRGLVVKSSVLLEKTKLEEEIKQLHEKITQLENLVSNQQAEISKWKSRALTLKGKSKAENVKPPSPTTPTKRGFPFTADSSSLVSSPKKFVVTARKALDSPRKALDSPRKALHSPRKALDSPRKLDSVKSQFFDVDGSSEVLSRTCPKQFFDNSRLGMIPDAAAGTENKEEWWPMSPKQEEMCKTQ